MLFKKASARGLQQNNVLLNVGRKNKEHSIIGSKILESLFPVNVTPLAKRSYRAGDPGDDKFRFQDERNGI